MRVWVLGQIGSLFSLSLSPILPKVVPIYISSFQDLVWYSLVI